MASLANVAVRRPVATAMAYLVVVTLGLVGLRFLPVDLLPEIEFPQLTVYVDYGNVGPEEMEAIVTDPLENALSSVPNLEGMTSSSTEGRSRVRLEFARGTDLSEAANDVRAALDRLRDDLPPEAEPPGIWKFDPNAQEIVTLSVDSRLDLATTTRILEREVARRFEQIPGVGAITVSGGIYREIEVRLQRDRLRAAGLTPADVRDALARENVQLPGGNVKAGVQDLYVRTLGEFGSVAEIGAVVAGRAEGGGPIRVRDVAEVVDGFADVSNLAELDGVPVLRLEIQKQSGANTVRVAELVRDEMARINADRADLRLSVLTDQSTFIRRSIESVQGSALWGGLLAVLVLYAFLRNGSTTAIIATSIPISIVATFGVLYFNGLTLNQMTFGGLALGIGLIVDNAIVVLENVVRHRREGRSLPEAARVGTREVAGAVVASTLTTSVIFLPVVFMRTTSGQLFQTLALVVVFALGCSLLVALTLVPMLASRFLSVRPAAGDTGPPSRGERWMGAVEGWYVRRLRGAFAHRRLLFGGVAAALAGAVALWPLVPVELAPETDANEIEVEARLARGTNLAVAKTYLDELVERIRPLLPADDVVAVSTEVRGDNADIEILLKDAGERSVDPSALADRIRAEVAGTLPGAEVEVQAQSGLWILRRLFSSGGGNEDLELQLRGYDLDQARALSAQVQRRLGAVPGIVEVRVEQREGRPEENLRLDREKIYALGLSVEQVGRAVQTSVGGTRAGYFREGGEQFPITVRMRPADRLTTQDLGSISVRTPAGEVVPVSSLVRQEAGRGPTEINHVDGQRVTYITANLASGVALGDAVERARAALSDLPLPEGFGIVFGGAYREQEESRRDFVIAVLLALALVYMVMAGQFERFVDPLVVMVSVPVALIGVVPTLLLTGTTLNVQSVMGLVMLIGIVVNNAIVLVDYVNLMRRERGMDPRAAAEETARLRLRPILMTSLTTILGLLPLALGLGAGANLQAPLARVVVGGLLASTVVTLFLVPVLYVTVARATERVRERLGRGAGGAPVPAEAAGD